MYQMYQKLLKWCKDSEVILWARIQYIGGAVIGLVAVLLPVLSSQDFSILGFSPKVVASIALTNGVLTELLRTYRATDLKVS